MASASQQGAWRLIVCAILLSNHLPNVIFTLIAAVRGPSLLHSGGSIFELYYLLSFIAPFATICCAARLLFGGKRWLSDKWLGYIGAFAASYALASECISLSPWGELLPLLAGGTHETSVINVAIGIAFSCAAVWAGLTLARDGAGAIPRRPEIAPMLYLLVGGFALSAVVAQTISLATIQKLSPLPVIQLVLHLCLLGSFGAAVALMMLDGAAMLVPASDQPAAGGSHGIPGLLQRALGAVASAAFWADLLTSLIITIVLAGIAYGIVRLVPDMIAAFLLPVIVFILLIGPIIVFMRGVMAGRPGFALAPALVFIAVLCYASANPPTAANDTDPSVEVAGLNGA
jgi:hypothetical protein